MNAEETKLMRQRQRDSFFNTEATIAKFTVTTMHHLSFFKINLYHSEKNSKGKKAIFITARLLNVENKQKNTQLVN